jgi:hypothetical protein
MTAKGPPASNTSRAAGDATVRETHRHRLELCPRLDVLQGALQVGANALGRLVGQLDTVLQHRHREVVCGHGRQEQPEVGVWSFATTAIRVRDGLSTPTQVHTHTRASYQVTERAKQHTKEAGEMSAVQMSPQASPARSSTTWPSGSFAEAPSHRFASQPLPAASHAALGPERQRRFQAQPVTLGHWQWGDRRLTHDTAAVTVPAPAKSTSACPAPRAASRTRTACSWDRLLLEKEAGTAWRERLVVGIATVQVVVSSGRTDGQDEDDRRRRIAVTVNVSHGGRRRLDEVDTQVVLDELFNRKQNLLFSEHLQHQHLLHAIQ